MFQDANMAMSTGIAFISAGAVGIYMMLSTRQVARGLHERFNEQNKLLSQIVDVLQRIENKL